LGRNALAGDYTMNANEFTNDQKAIVGKKLLNSSSGQVVQITSAKKTGKRAFGWVPEFVFTITDGKKTGKIKTHWIHYGIDSGFLEIIL